MNSPFRRSLLWSGLAGLCFDGLLTALATWLVAGGIIRPPFPQPVITLVLALILGGISVGEIPVMILAMRHLAAERPGNQLLVVGLNTVYVFFAAVYGLPVLLLTGSRVWGWLLCSLALVRLATSLILVQTPGTPASGSHRARVPIDRLVETSEPASGEPAEFSVSLAPGVKEES